MTKGMSTGDLLVPKIEQGRTGQLEKSGEAEPSASGRQVPIQPVGPVQWCLIGGGKMSWQISARFLTGTIASSVDPAAREVSAEGLLPGLLTPRHC